MVKKNFGVVSKRAILNEYVQKRKKKIRDAWRAGATVLEKNNRIARGRVKIIPNGGIFGGAKK